jgi:hypothetical protein
MRFAFIIVLTLTACSREPSFDERYTATQQQLAKKSATIERELAAATATASDAAADGQPITVTPR